MELRIEPYSVPGQILFNFDELKAELMEKVKTYETIVYTEDQIKNAKSDRAALNKLKKALNDERIRREREYMEPFKQFKAQIDEIISIIDKPVAVNDRQVKAFEEAQRAEKLEKIITVFNGLEFPDFVHPQSVIIDKWLNASVGMSIIESTLKERREWIEKDLETLSRLPEFSFEAIDEYKQTLNLGVAIDLAHRLSDIAKKKAESEATAVQAAPKPAPDETDMVVVHTPVQSPEPEWIRFRALLTVEDATALKAFFTSRNIKFEAI